jgi:uncharacterized protein YggE
MTPSYGYRTPAQPIDGVAVVGEAMRRVAPESAEFLIEITAAGHTATQALQEHQTRSAQLAQAVAPLGVQRDDLQSISLNVFNVYAPVLPMLSPFAGAQQIGPGMDIQFGSYQVRNLVRVRVRETARVGEVVDTLAKAGAALAGGFSFHVADEAGARRSALDAAARDARSKAETLAAAAGKQVGDPQAIFEDVVAANGVYAALRTQAPFAFGPGTPTSAGELEYYARVTASFRFQ